MSSTTDYATLIFQQGFNCAQAVLSAFSKGHGLDEKTALKIAAGFGGGVARQGETCGAVTGALMALGLARAGLNPEDKEENYRLAQEFLGHFKGKRGSLLCRELIGYDLSIPEERTKAQNSGVTKTICPSVVKEAVEILDIMLASY